jgi:hypothetical protein
MLHVACSQDRYVEIHESKRFIELSLEEHTDIAFYLKRQKELLVSKVVTFVNEAKGLGGRSNVCTIGGP